jgi:hypothetical protein
VTQDSRQQGNDPVGDFQRWLMRSGARGLGKEVRGNIRKTFGYGEAGRDDVWGSATSEPEGGAQPPECEWCPLCRAARKMKDSGPGLSSHLSSAGDAFASVVREAVDAFEAVIATGSGPRRPSADANSGAAESAGAAAGAEPADAGTGSGAAPADAGAGPLPDASPLPDAGPLPDASPLPDAGPLPDASRLADAGPLPDAADNGADRQAATGEPPEGPAGGPDDWS